MTCLPAKTLTGRGLEWMESGGPMPAGAIALAEEFDRRLDSLGDDTLRQVALLRAGGYLVAQIATRIGQMPRNVERGLGRIRER